MTFETNRMRRVACPASVKAGMALLAVALIIGSVAPGLADDDDTNTGGFTDSIGNAIGNSVTGMKKAMGMNKAAAPPPEESPSGCPEIEILDGTGAQRIMANAEAGNAGLRYQYSINDVARECHVAGNQMTLKVGVEGRVLLGPAGTAGSFDVPVRIVVVNKLDEKPSVSKLFKVGASIPTGRTSAPYSLVADALTIPFAAGRTAKDYSIKVGIDTAGKGDATAKPARVRKVKPVAATQ